MSKINSAESIRGLACMAVVFSHMSLIYFPFLHNFESRNSSENLIIDALHHSPFGFLFSGTAAVYVFFVLSGFVLSYAILSKQNVNEKILSMAIKRYPRLGIPALLSCILIYFVLYLIDIDKSQVSYWMQDYGQSGTLLNAVYEGTIGAFIFGESTLNFVLWTMQVELLASLGLFALLYAYNNSSKYIFYILSLIIPFLFLSISIKLFLGMFSFIGGMYLYLYGKKLPSLLTIPSLILGLYFAGIHVTSASYSLITSILGSKSYQLLNFLSGFLIVYGVLFNERISSFLDNKSLVLLGKLSFSIYLLHVICLYAISIPLFNILNEYLGYNLAAILASICSIALILIFANYYSKYVDDLSIKVANKIESKVKSMKREKAPV
ncbi:acyltransferase family protein [Acinetobacter nosocomialis]|uniref:acyltransferase family protein n=2 Tax=Acinetobacter nosocomialis TaxID=106654 RepID=UPI00125056E4|nr:acyltransferase [Acinetobacter nosocomialis]